MDVVTQKITNRWFNSDFKILCTFNSSRKSRKNTELGVKLSVSCIDKYIFLLPISWENYNESEDLKVTIE